MLRQPGLMRISAVMALVVLLSACSGVFKTKTVDYRSARSLPTLEIPPDLSSLPTDRNLPATVTGRPTTAVYSRDAARDKTRGVSIRSTLLPTFDGIELKRQGNLRWLVVKAKLDEIWPQLREFFLQRGLLVAKENQSTGIMETAWAENRAHVGSKSQRRLGKWFKSLYSTGLRDKFRIRLEQGGEPGTVEIYLSHRGVKEVIAGGSGSDIVQTIWQPRPPDPGLELEMMRLLMIHLGLNKERAQRAVVAVKDRPLRATLKRDSAGFPFMALYEDPARAWRRVGISLDRVGFTVEDRDRSRGVYYVRYVDPKKEFKKKGFFSRMFRKKKNIPSKQQYQVSLKPAESGTQVAVLDVDGKPDKSKISKRILALLYEQLK